MSMDPPAIAEPWSPFAEAGSEADLIGISGVGMTVVPEVERTGLRSLSKPPRPFPAPP